MNNSISMPKPELIAFDKWLTVRVRVRGLVEVTQNHREDIEHAGPYTTELDSAEIFVDDNKPVKVSSLSELHCSIEEVLELEDLK